MPVRESSSETGDSDIMGPTGLRLNLSATLESKRCEDIESKMALFSECRLWCARKLLDTVDLVPRKQFWSVSNAAAA
jgi:hypothetical protein